RLSGDAVQARVAAIASDDHWRAPAHDRREGSSPRLRSHWPSARDFADCAGAGHGGCGRTWGRATNAGRKRTARYRPPPGLLIMLETYSLTVSTTSASCLTKK